MFLAVLSDLGLLHPRQDSVALPPGVFCLDQEAETLLARQRRPFGAAP